MRPKLLLVLKAIAIAVAVAIADTLTVQKAMEELYGPVLIFRNCPLR